MQSCINFYSEEPKSVTAFNLFTFFHADINQSEVEDSFQLETKTSHTFGLLSVIKPTKYIKNRGMFDESLSTIRVIEVCLFVCFCSVLFCFVCVFFLVCNFVDL